MYRTNNSRSSFKHSKYTKQMEVFPTDGLNDKWKTCKYGHYQGTMRSD